MDRLPAVVYLLIITVPFIGAPCPPAATDDVCTCRDFDRDSSVTCYQKMLDPKLKTVPDLSKYRGIPLSGFSVAKNNINHIPDDAFFGLSFFGASALLYDNPIRSISKHAFRGIIGTITYVKLNNCKLKEFPEALSVLPNITILLLKNNEISVMPLRAFQPFGNLFSISLQGNQIKNINSDYFFSGLEYSLQNVDLNSMKIKFFPSKALKNLRHLQRIDLSNNIITTLSADVFNGFQTKMKVQIQLENNKIFSISSHSFRKTPISMCLLDLSTNKLTNLDFLNVCEDDFKCDSPTNVFYQPSIVLKRDPLTCDCETINHLSPEDLQIDGNCDQPSMYHGLNLNDFYQNRREECPDSEPIDCSSGLKSSVPLLTMLTCLLIDIELYAYELLH